MVAIRHPNTASRSLSLQNLTYLALPLVQYHDLFFLTLLHSIPKLPTSVTQLSATGR